MASLAYPTEILVVERDLRSADILRRQRHRPVMCDLSEPLMAVLTQTAIDCSTATDKAIPAFKPRAGRIEPPRPFFCHTFSLLACARAALPPAPERRRGERRKPGPTTQRTSAYVIGPGSQSTGPLRYRFGIRFCSPGRTGAGSPPFHRARSASLAGFSYRPGN